MGPPGGGRTFITQRYIRHFNVLNFVPFSDQSLTRIFVTIVDWFLAKGKYEAAVTGLSTAMVKATIDVYNTIALNLLPTPSKSHYLFNLRDIRGPRAGGGTGSGGASPAPAVGPRRPRMSSACGAPGSCRRLPPPSSFRGKATTQWLTRGPVQGDRSHMSTGYKRGSSSKLPRARRSPAPSLAMPFSPEETPRPCLHERTPPLLQARRLAAHATGISGSFSVKTNAAGSGGGSSSWVERAAVQGSGTRMDLWHLPGLCSARGGVAGLEQRGVEQHESPRGCCRWGPSEARCAPLVRLLLLSDPWFLVQRHWARPGAALLGFVPRLTSSAYQGGC